MPEKEDNKGNMSDFDDLIFESRNKDYGAYQLRKRYSSVVIGGILVSSIIFASLIIIPFIVSPRADRVLTGSARYVQFQMDNLEPPVEQIYVPPAPPPPQAVKVQDIVKYIPPLVVDSILPFEIKQASNDEILSQSTLDPLEITGTGTGEDLISGQDGMLTDEPFFLVEIMPSFKGGDINKFRDWVQKRTNYPQIAIDNKIQGKVFLTFIIEPNGDVSNVTIVKGVDPMIDNEAVKAIEASPRWTPGLQRGQPVRVRFSMWLNFVV